MKKGRRKNRCLRADRKGEQVQHVQQGSNTESLLLALLFWLVLREPFGREPFFRYERGESGDDRKTLDEFWKNWAMFYQAQKEKGNV